MVSIQEAQLFNVVLKAVVISIPVVLCYAMKPKYFIVIDCRGKIHECIFVLGREIDVTSSYGMMIH